MLAEFLFTDTNNITKLDELLMTGWFRCADFFFRGQFICLDEKISSMIKIRLPLSDYHNKKGHRRITRNVEESFRVEIGNVSISDQKETLYNSFKEKFHGFIYGSLSDIIHGSFDQPMHITNEISVYDDDRLIALSYFDCGKNSIASSLALYDLSYQKYRLGTFTMLKEIEFGIKNGFKYYYPGHLLDNNPVYNYKLSVGHCQFLDENNEWKTITTPTCESSLLQKIMKITQQIENELTEQGIEYIKKLNPYYAYGYIEHFPDQMIKSIMPIFIPFPNDNRRLLIEFDLDAHEYILSEIRKTIRYNSLMETVDYSYYSKPDVYLQGFHIYLNRLACSPSIQGLIRDYIAPLIKNT